LSSSFSFAGCMARCFFSSERFFFFACCMALFLPGFFPSSRAASLCAVLLHAPAALVFKHQVCTGNHEHFTTAFLPLSLEHHEHLF
jgi:hypothetical protein